MGIICIQFDDYAILARVTVFIVAHINYPVLNLVLGNNL